ncbi:RagB/SusD family nutrient uptake outer membrane protein [Pedobacter sp. ASV28]|uniref:RagB/SusD family nutrient uptake outer membrane protein n=1 Tax=Pedobacter sp. ASV28 TaxID=2795123 RepID=UPI0018EA988E|nr:RagB/SusD family nutrient uptake outer membrane protein [Pedobacter sp. ASV28]
MKKLKYLFFILVLPILLGSCSKWLDVQPEDKLTEQQIYSSRGGVAEVINALYLKLGSNNLYGQNLTLDKLDLFAHRYHAYATNSRYYNFIHHNYEDETVKASIDNIWKGLYEVIGNANQFLANLKKYPGVLTKAQEEQYMGEALAIRSLAHFDLLRLFGPVYAQNPMAPSIPYYRNLGAEVGSFLPANVVLQYILEDLDQAIVYLGKDPIINQNGTDNYNNYRLNLYATLVLKARALMWRGEAADKAKALVLVKQVIANAAKFPWVTHAEVTGSAADANRIFSTEILFGTFNNKLYEQQNLLFSSSISELRILSTGPSNYVDNVYEGNQGDYRFVYSWPYPSGGAVTFRTFIKYQDMSTSTLTRRFTIPLIRLSEAYYIAAECETDQNQALDYLNTVRQKRNLLVNITNYNNLRSELTKEYLKEFYGEGQLWYYYKRNQFTSIPSPNTVSGAGNFSIALSTYVFPIPDSELNSR